MVRLESSSFGAIICIFQADRKPPLLSGYVKVTVVESGCQYLEKIQGRRPWIERITLTLFYLSIEKDSVEYSLPFDNRPDKQRKYAVKNFPLLRWSDGSAWLEGNIWLKELANGIPLGDYSIKSLESVAYGLLTFMRFSDAENLAWNYLPIVQGMRTINRYRGHLITLREVGEIKPSTASTKMSFVIRMCRWAQHAGLLGNQSFESVREKVVSISDRYGRTADKIINFSSLRIRNKRAGVDRVEDGILPVSNVYRDSILNFTKNEMSYELYLMLRIGFETGLRVQSVCDLKVNTIRWARQDSINPGIHWLSVGPNVSGAPVDTKFGVNGEVLITADLLDELNDYANSMNRLHRESKADESVKGMLFLTGHGTPYKRKDSSGGHLNNMISEMKKKAQALGMDFSDFRFHRTRATFGVSIVQAGLSCTPPIHLTTILSFARDCMLHADIRTTMLYVKFVQNSQLKEKYANEYTAMIFGLCESKAA